jgi:hypothetical protein
MQFENGIPPCFDIWSFNPRSGGDLDKNKSYLSLTTSTVYVMGKSFSSFILHSWESILVSSLHKTEQVRVQLYFIKFYVGILD